MAGPALTEFTGRVLSVVRRIPAGRVATYGQVAALAGRPGAARAVGNIMRTSSIPGLPYHRVVAAGGRLGGYGGNELVKRDRLIAEGIRFSGTRIRQFEAVCIDDDGPRRRSSGAARTSILKSQRKSPRRPGRRTAR